MNGRRSVVSQDWSSLLCYNRDLFAFLLPSCMCVCAFPSPHAYPLIPPTPPHLLFPTHSLIAPVLPDGVAENAMVIEPSQPAEMADVDSEGDSDMVREQRGTRILQLALCICPPKFSFGSSSHCFFSFSLFRAIQRMMLVAQMSKEI